MCLQYSNRESGTQILVLLYDNVHGNGFSHVTSNAEVLLKHKHVRRTAAGRLLCRPGNALGISSPQKAGADLCATYLHAVKKRFPPPSFLFASDSSTQNIHEVQVFGDWRRCDQGIESKTLRETTPRFPVRCFSKNT